MIKLVEHDATAYESIAEIERESFSIAWGLKEYRDFNSHEFVQIYVNEDAGEINGFIIFSNVLGDVEIFRIAVRRENRGQGIGMKLMNVAMENATSGISLEVRCGNTPAIKLYEKCGLERMGIRKNYYENGEDAYVYGRKIL